MCPVTFHTFVRLFSMQFSNNVFLIVGGALIAIIFLIAIVRTSSKKIRRTTRPTSRGPASMQFVCAGCSQQFMHTKRTVAAWEKGTRRFYCNTCHQKWRGSRPPQELQASSPVSAPSQAPASRARDSDVRSSVRTSHSFTESRSGCLGITVIFIALPVIFLFATYLTHLKPT